MLVDHYRAHTILWNPLSQFFCHDCEPYTKPLNNQQILLLTLSKEEIQLVINHNAIKQKLINKKSNANKYYLFL